MTVYDEIPVVDSEWDDSFGPAPKRAIIAWEQVSLDRLPNGPRRVNPDFKPGAIWHGYDRPATKAEALVRYYQIGWLGNDDLGPLLPDLDVIIRVDDEGAPSLSDNGEYVVVYASEAELYPSTPRWQHIQVRALRQRFPDKGLVFAGRVQVDRPAIPASAFTEVPAPDTAAPVTVIAPELDPRFEAHNKELWQEFGYNPHGYLSRKIVDARKLGYSMTLPELMTTARGAAILNHNYKKRRANQQADWPSELRANGLIDHYDHDGSLLPQLWSDGKIYPFPHRGFAYGNSYEKVVGAYVGFALGEALGIAADEGRFPDDGPLRWGGLTRQLLAQTESVMLGFGPDYARGMPVPASLPPARKDSWWALASGEIPPAPQEFSSLLTTALAASLANGDAIVTTFPVVPDVARELIGSAAGEDLSESVLLLADVLVKVLGKGEYPFPLVVHLREMAEKGNAVAKSIIELRDDRAADDEAQLEALGDGRSPSSVLARALLATAKREYDPRTALTNAMNLPSSRPITCALVGALLGARDGLPRLPKAWVDALDKLGIVHNLAEDAYWHFANQGALTDEREKWAKRYPSPEA
ncbi:ADP-ribosylglycohydrolase family protein [Amycolatopsis sp. cg5]|uniref:ADP-ribosylglycohydrolase family protein n=1 Tax=Amycolatopsis sp. cg5 TaxID=3238802 RepID=UPI0035232C8B